MKKFTAPAMEVEKLDVADVITTSTTCVGNTEMGGEEL